MDIRNTDLGKMIEAIFPKKANSFDEKENHVIIGEGKYANKCSFRETDKEYYNKLIEYTFVMKDVKFVDKNRKCCKDYSRNTAIENAIKYLKECEIDIDSHFCSEKEKYFLSSYICSILKEFLQLMFSFENKLNERKYIKKRTEISTDYQKEIIIKGLSNVIYSGRKWSEVESYKEEDSNICLLINNDYEFMKIYDIRCVDTTIAIRKNTEQPFDDNVKPIEIEYISGLNNKPIQYAQSRICHLTIFNCPCDYYVPIRFCYQGKLDENDNLNTDDITNFANKYIDQTPSGISKLQSRAIHYLKDNYCTDIESQYMNKLSNISEIISCLLRINYNEFYSEKFNLSKSSFGVGFEQLKHYIKENELNYSQEEVEIIYKYLISQWMSSFGQCLELFDFSAMYNIYERSSNEYKQSIEKNMKKINKFESLNILDGANDKYKQFYKSKKAIIESFERNVSVEGAQEKLYAQLNNTEYYDEAKIKSGKFYELKEMIRSFQNKLNWKVPYYIRRTKIEGKKKRYLGDDFIEYKQVNEYVDIPHDQDEKYTIEGPDKIKLSFNYYDNIAEIKYIMKEEYLPEADDNKSDKEIKNDNAVLKFEKDHKYRIEFEIYGQRNAVLSCVLIRNSDNGIEIIFNNDMNVKPEFTKYSYEFTYKGETGDNCYLNFGFNNEICGFLIRNVKLLDIE